MKGALVRLPEALQAQLEPVPPAAREMVAQALAGLPAAGAPVIVVVVQAPAPPAVPDAQTAALVELVGLVRDLVKERDAAPSVEKLPTEAEMGARFELRQERAKASPADREARRRCEELPGMEELARAVEQDYRRRRRRRK